MNYEQSKLLVSQVALSECFTSTGKKLRKHVPKLLFWGRIFLDKISLKLVTFHITKACKNAWYICIYVCVVYDVYIMSRWVTDSVTWEISEEASSWRSAGGLLEGRYTLSLDLFPSAIGAWCFFSFPYWYEGYWAILVGRAVCLWEMF